jgi:hypothetical protein
MIRQEGLRSLVSSYNPLFLFRFLISQIHPLSAPFKATTVGGIITCKRFSSAVGLNEARFLEDLARFGLLARLTRAVSGAELPRLRWCNPNLHQEKAPKVGFISIEPNTLKGGS